MCYLSYIPASTPFKREWITNAIASNRDGWGVAAIKAGHLHTFFMGGDGIPAFKDSNLPSNSSAVQWLLEGKHGGALFHARYATHGGRASQQMHDNVHPFTTITNAWGRVALAHNGVIPGTEVLACKFEAGHGSDTAKYANAIFERIRDAKRGTNFVNAVNKAIAGIEQTSGISIDGQKLVLLTSSGECAIVGTELGHWHEDCWHSNTGYKGWQDRGGVSYGYSSKKSSGLSNSRLWDDDDYYGCGGMYSYPKPKEEPTLPLPLPNVPAQVTATKKATRRTEKEPTPPVALLSGEVKHLDDLGTPPDDIFSELVSYGYDPEDVTKEMERLDLIDPEDD